MNIAIIGIRGVPVIYSAFETFAQVLGTELKKRRHAVFVYCRSGHVAKDAKIYKGINLITLPHMKGKHFSTFSHSLFSTIVF